MKSLSKSASDIRTTLKDVQSLAQAVTTGSSQVEAIIKTVDKIANGVRVAFANRGCTAQSKNFGNLTLNKCAEQAFAEGYKHIMHSPNYPVWGCRACKDGEAGNGGANNNWQTYVLSAASGVKALVSAEEIKAWEQALDLLVKTLDVTADDSQKIRLDLEKIQKDLVNTKAAISGMVASAQGKFKEMTNRLQAQVDNAQRAVNDNTGCFKDVGRAFATIFSFGIACAVQDNVLNQLKANKRNLENHKNAVIADVGPALSKLNTLDHVAS